MAIEINVPYIGADEVEITEILVKVGDKVENVKIQALQRHPSKNTPMHADFKRA